MLTSLEFIGTYWSTVFLFTWVRLWIGVFTWQSVAYICLALNLTTYTWLWDTPMVCFFESTALAY